MKAFQVGEHVQIIGDNNLEYEIIATIRVPHVAIDKTIISVPTGYEYILRALNQKKDFEPYRYALGKLLERI